MVETVTGSSSSGGLADAARLLHDFNAEYDEPAPPPDELAGRLAELILGDHVTVLLARAPECKPDMRSCGHEQVGERVGDRPPVAAQMQCREHL